MYTTCMSNELNKTISFYMIHCKITLTEEWKGNITLSYMLGQHTHIILFGVISLHYSPVIRIIQKKTMRLSQKKAIISNYCAVGDRLSYMNRRTLAINRGSHYMEQVIFPDSFRNLTRVSLASILCCYSACCSASCQLHIFPSPLHPFLKGICF